MNLVDHCAIPRLSVAVMGAGSVGCYFGALLARAGHRSR
jgi:2-dehydropantoate 2-reductase